MWNVDNFAKWDVIFHVKRACFKLYKCGSVNML